jgi:hypothetical protein
MNWGKHAVAMCMVICVCMGLLQIQIRQDRKRLRALENPPAVERPVEHRTLNEKVGAPPVLPNKPRVR